MRESELHQHIFDRSRGLIGSFPRVVVGPGDDAAVVRAGGDAPLLAVTVDQLIEGRHYEPRRLESPEGRDLVARKAIARSISDLAAMGAAPHWSLATAALPGSFKHADDLFDRMARWASHWECPLVGGDIASTEGPLTLTVTAAGGFASDPDARGPVLRSHATPGDLVCVTGSLGGWLESEHHLRFEPRVIEAAWLARTLGPHLGAMIDLSDGLGRDAARLADASGVRLELDADRLPPRRSGLTLESMLGDGEDYELCFTLRPDAGRSLPACSPETGVPFTIVGRVLGPGEGPACTVRRGNDRLDASRLGWDH